MKVSSQEHPWGSHTDYETHHPNPLRHPILKHGIRFCFRNKYFFLLFVVTCPLCSSATVTKTFSTTYANHEGSPVENNEDAICCTNNECEFYTKPVQDVWTLQQSDLVHEPCMNPAIGRRPKALYKFQGFLQKCCVTCVQRIAKEYMEENECDLDTAVSKILN